MDEKGHQILLKNLEKQLEIHFCDIDETGDLEDKLAGASYEYFQSLDLEKYVKIFSALAEEKRLKILILLTIREMCNCELTAATKSTQPNLTYHIKILENAGLVTHRKQGKYRYYSLSENALTRKILENICN